MPGAVGGGGGGGPLRFSQTVVMLRLLGCLATVGATTALCAFDSYNQQIRVLRANVPGTVISCEIKTQGRGNQNAEEYVGQVVYGYQVGMARFKSTCYYPGSASSLQHEPVYVGQRGKVESQLAPFARGRPVTVYYEPNDPGNSCLELPEPRSAGQFLVVFCLGLAGLSVLVLAPKLLDKVWKFVAPTGVDHW